MEIEALSSVIECIVWDSACSSNGLSLENLMTDVCQRIPTLGHRNIRFACPRGFWRMTRRSNQVRGGPPLRGLGFARFFEIYLSFVDLLTAWATHLFMTYRRYLVVWKYLSARLSFNRLPMNGSTSRMSSRAVSCGISQALDEGKSSHSMSERPWGWNYEFVIYRTIALQTRRGRAAMQRMRQEGNTISTSVAHAFRRPANLPLSLREMTESQPPMCCWSRKI